MNAESVMYIIMYVPSTVPNWSMIEVLLNDIIIIIMYQNYITMSQGVAKLEGIWQVGCIHIIYIFIYFRPTSCTCR